VFSTTWLGFIGFWTAGAAHSSFFFAAFSAPFWLAGFGMAGRLVSPLVRRTTLVLDREGGVLAVRPFGKTRTLRLDELRVTMDDRQAMLLHHGTETIPLLEGFSEAEQIWVFRALSAWLAEHRSVTLPE
jgi:hypothetical protein